MRAGRNGVVVALIAAAGVFSSLGTPATSLDLWSGFYTPTTAPEPRTQPRRKAPPALSSNAVCLHEIMEAQARYNIPDNLLLAIGLQEAGRRLDGVDTVWPWTANALGQGAFLPNRNTLKSWVLAKQSEGIQSIDVGCMQVNLRWHGEAFRSLDHAMEPRANVDYAARFLLSLKQATGDWWEAAGRYHSGTEKYKNIYLDKLRSNWQRAHSGHDAMQTLIASAHQSELIYSADPEAAPVEVQLPTVHWTSELSPGSDGDSGGSHSIYSAAPIQSVFDMQDKEEVFQK